MILAKVILAVMMSLFFTCYIVDVIISIKKKQKVINQKLKELDELNEALIRIEKERRNK